MAAITSTIIAGIGLAATAYGSYKQYQGQKAATKAANKAEVLREQQMNLDSQRAKRNIIRESVMSRAMALSNMTATGAAAGSATQGAFGAVQAQGGSNLAYNAQSTAIGSGIFAANRAANTAGTMSSFGSGITSLGNTLMANSEAAGRLVNYGYGKMKNAYA